MENDLRIKLEKRRIRRREENAAYWGYPESDVVSQAVMGFAAKVAREMQMGAWQQPAQRDDRRCTFVQRAGL